MTKILPLLFLLTGTLSAFSQATTVVIFQDFAGGKKLVNDSTYTNIFGEPYRVSKLKYYVSDLQFTTAEKKKQRANIFLTDAAIENRFTISKPAGKITGIEFLLGVDSILNCSGAQNDALDPLNGMFWTWNNGYIVFKLEGTSDSSKADQQRIEYHIGGYRDPFKTMRKIFLPLDDKAANSREINIRADLDNFWRGKNDIRIAALPVLMSEGSVAAGVADNFPGMFSVVAQ